MHTTTLVLQLLPGTLLKILIIIKTAFFTFLILLPIKIIISRKFSLSIYSFSCILNRAGKK